MVFFPIITKKLRGVSRWDDRPNFFDQVPAKYGKSRADGSLIEYLVYAIFFAVQPENHYERRSAEKRAGLRRGRL